MPSIEIPPSLDFYRALEDRHRGSREIIKARLQVYLPFSRHLAELHPGAPMLDLGCGRGEWLELLRDAGIAARGIDLDEGMLAACRQRGLGAFSADALSHLKAQPDGSLALITGFHLAEHLPFPDLQQLVHEVRRVLRPGGAFILETPNPENLLVATSAFYLDPTHRQPLPPALLSFLLEYHRFAQVKVLRLQESVALAAADATPELFDVLTGVSPDYCVVGCTEAAPPRVTALAEFFPEEQGLTLHTLTGRYDQGIRVHLDAAAQAAREAQAIAYAAAAEAARCRAEQARLAEQLQAELQAIHASASWRLTRPLRWLSRLLRTMAGRS